MIFSLAEQRAWEMTPRYKMSAWANAYRVVSKGPARGHWSSQTMPILDGIMDACHEPDNEKTVVVGPQQGGKTEASIVNPFLYFCLFQRRDTFILYPEMATAKANWQEKISPAIHATPELKSLMYAKHEMGSLDSGRRFRNGATLFMTGADSESAMTSRSVEVVLVDEADYIRPPRAGRADPIEMAFGRSSAYPNTRKLFLSCTVTTPEGRIWIEYLAGDRRLPWVPCPHCGEYVVLLWDGAIIDGERRGGMQFDESSDVKAKKSAVWLCPHCATAVRDSHRADMYRNYRWLKDGQTADKAGIVTGTPPPNSTASFWYSSLYVPWWTFGKLAAEYVKTRGDEEKERDFQIHRLVIPWVNPSIEIETVTTEAIRAHVIDYPKDEIPAEADLVVCAADVHRHLVYWVAVAFRKADQTAWLVHEGVVEVWTPEGLARGPQEAEQRAVLSALREWHQTLQAGWPKTPYKEPLKYQFVGVDYQYCSDAVSRFVREAGQAKHFAVQGYGTSSRVRWKAPRFHEDAKADEIRRAHVYSTILADRTRLLHSDADWAKRAVHKALGVPPGSPGTLYLYPEVSHAFTKHLQAERWIDDEGGGHFEVVNNNNHFLDCMGMAYVLADLAGVTQLGPPAARPARPPARRVRKAEPGLNYRRLNYRG